MKEFVYFAMYVDNPDDGGQVLSVHRTESGAKKVIDNHKEKTRREWEEFVESLPEDHKLLWSQSGMLDWQSHISLKAELNIGQSSWNSDSLN